MRSIEWRDGKVRFLDQSRLPLEEHFIETDSEDVVAQAIRTLALRGAPLIGIAAAYAFALSFQRRTEFNSASFNSHLERVSNLLRSTRPTAVNLFWAIDRMRHVAIHSVAQGPDALAQALLAEAMAIHGEDAEHCRAIGISGAEVLPTAAMVLTHCNTCALATGGEGTALSVIKAAWESHKLKHVYVDETRPLLQGSRLTTWELNRLGIPFTLITDNTAAFLLQQGKVNVIVVGADRIAGNGDVANKVGTYGLAVQARFHKVPFFVAAPTSTIDLSTASGKGIPIEQRDGREVTEIAGVGIAPPGTEVYSPAFDITPSELITGIITEHGVFRQPLQQSLSSWHATKALRDDHRSAR